MRTAIVTGASRGFGLAVAKALLENDWKIVIDARGNADLKEAAASLGRGNDAVIWISGDVSDSDHVSRLVESATDLGDLELLVNNAGLLGPSPQPSLAEYPTESLAEVLRVNLLGPLGLIQLALPWLRENGGAIVNITSDAAVTPYEGWGGYGASKAALEQLSNVLAVEEPAVGVYWFDPGDMRTRMHQDAFPGEDISDRPLPAERAPGLMALLDKRPPSGRYTAESFLAGASA